MSNTGVVKWFSDKRGYGFIVDAKTGFEYFVHYSDPLLNVNLY